MKNLDEKLVNIYEMLSDYLEEVGYLEEKEDKKEEVKEELAENDEKDDDMDDKDETYTEEEVQEILNRE